MQDPGIPGTRKALIVSMLHSFHLKARPGQDRQFRRSWRRVVNENDFKVLKRLGCERGQSLIEPCLISSIEWDDDWESGLVVWQWNVLRQLWLIPRTLFWIEWILYFRNLNDDAHIYELKKYNSEGQYAARKRVACLEHSFSTRPKGATFSDKRSSGL